MYPLTSVEIQIIGGKVYLMKYGKKLLGDVNKLFFFQNFVDNAQQYFA